MKCDKFDKCTKTDCGMCVDRGANMNEIRWTDKVYLDSQGNIRSSDGCSTEHYQNDFISNPTEVVKVGEPLPNSDEINRALEKGELYRQGFKAGYKRAIIDGKTNFSRPKGEREFIEIFAEDIPDDICTYPEYRGKPYYSIHYTQNGEDFVGFGTYSPKVLSRYLKEYFFEQKGSEEK